ncbi:MAG TPA: MFS transporter [Gaiellaceae bacterium]|nr:MFS transporter [Gaiellaceae bacterium]
MRAPNSLLRVRALFLLFGIAESAFLPFLPLLLRHRGLSAEAIGAVLALLAAVSVAAGPIWGYLADRILGYERTLILSLAGTAVGALAFGLADRVEMVALAGAGMWAVRSAGAAVTDSIALARLGQERRSLYGSVRLWMSAGFAVGAVVFGVLVQAVGLGVVAPLYAGFCALNAAGLAFVFRGRRLRPSPRARARREHRRLLPVALLPALVLFLVALFLTNAAYNASYTFGAVQIAKLGGGALFVGLASSFQAAAEVPSMAWTRRLSRRVRPVTIFAGGAAIYVGVFLVWSLAATPATLAALRLVAGVGFGLTYVGTVLVTEEIVPAELRATGQAATKAVGFGLAPIAGSLGGGIVYGGFGATVFFLVAAAITAVAAVLARRVESVGLSGQQPKLEHA